MDELKQLLSDVAFGPTTAYGAEGVSQFTIDWAESKHDDIIDREERPDEHCSENDFFGATSYDVANILQIMKPGLPDLLFFQKVEQLAARLFV